jgi:5-methylcytosine-specific restriction endonuclease McrA
MSVPISRFVLWFRMQALRQDATGAMVLAVHADPEMFSFRMYSAIRRHLHATEAHQDFLPLFYEAVREFDRYHKRDFDDMPCLVCRASLLVLPREEVDVIWKSQAGIEGHTYGFLHKPCFAGIDSPALDVETLDRLLNPQQGYTRLLTKGWIDALRRLWPDPHKRPSRAQKSASPVVRTARLHQAQALREVRKLASRFVIMQRDKFRCRLCGIAASDGAHVRLEVDHIIPRSKGGKDTAENKWVLCFECNRGKGTRLL